jgi:hypothetical protein
LAKTLDVVFGAMPLVLTMPQADTVLPDQKFSAFTAFFAGARVDALNRAFKASGAYQIPSGAAPDPSWPNGFEAAVAKDWIRFSPAKVEIPADLKVAEDVWPFLYLRGPMIPDLSWQGMGVIGGISLTMLWLFGRRTAGAGFAAGLQIAAGLQTWDASMLLLGAGFMLLETKAVVHAALLYGSTWVVNTMVFATILIMILAANVWVQRTKPHKLTGYYLALLAALAVNVTVPLDAFLGWPRSLQGAAAGLLLLSPVFCAGVIFATLFRTAENPARALACNTAGAILGGLAEASSMLIGFQWLLALAAAIYVGSWAFAPRQRR